MNGGNNMRMKKIKKELNKMKEKNFIRIRIVLWIILYPLILMWLWNFVMPKFGLVEINYIEAFVLKIISSILFKTNTAIMDDIKKIEKE